MAKHPHRTRGYSSDDSSDNKVKLPPIEVGDKAWYYGGRGNDPGWQHPGPMAAIVAFVHPESGLVNLSVLDLQGYQFSKQNVPFVSEGDDVPDADFCTATGAKVREPEEDTATLAPISPVEDVGHGA